MKPVPSSQIKPNVARLWSDRQSFHCRGRGDLIRRIVIFKLDHVGDLCLALDALAVLRRGFPLALLTLCCGRWNVGVARATGLVDEVVVIDFFAARADNEHAPFSAATLAPLAGRAFDLAIDLRLDFDTRVVLDHVDARLTCGFRSDRNARPLTIVVPAPAADTAEDNIGMHQRLTMSRLAHTVVDYLSPDPAIGALLRERVARAPKTSLGFALDRPYVACNTGSGRAVKDWPVERYASLVRWLFEVVGSRVLLLGSTDQAEDAESILRHCRSPNVVSLVGRTDLRESLGFVARAALFVGGDSGLTHFAARMEVPTVAIFSAVATASVWAPMGPSVDVVRLTVPCSPCNILHPRDCIADRRCTRDIDESVVRRVVRRRLMALEHRDARHRSSPPAAAPPAGTLAHLSA